MAVMSNLPHTLFLSVFSDSRDERLCQLCDSCNFVTFHVSPLVSESSFLIQLVPASCPMDTPTVPPPAYHANANGQLLSKVI